MCEVGAVRSERHTVNLYYIWKVLIVNSITVSMFRVFWVE